MAGVKKTQRFVICDGVLTRGGVNDGAADVKKKNFKK